MVQPFTAEKARRAWKMIKLWAVLRDAPEASGAAGEPGDGALAPPRAQHLPWSPLVVQLGSQAKCWGCGRAGKRGVRSGAAGPQRPAQLLMPHMPPH
jgi:hypothetical protein